MWLVNKVHDPRLRAYGPDIKLHLILAWCNFPDISYFIETPKYIEDIQIFGKNMPFISSSEAKNAYFMSGEATNEIYIFSLHEMK